MIYYSLVFETGNTYINVIAIIFMALQSVVSILLLANTIILHRKISNSCVIEIPKTEI